MPAFTSHPNPHAFTALVWEIVRQIPSGRVATYEQIGGDFPTGVDEVGTNFGAIRAGYVSIIPLQLDLTARDVIEEMKMWEWQ